MTLKTRLVLSLGGLFLGALSLGALAIVAAPALAADRAHPTVIELFQSQGCSSCPPADANLNILAATRPDVLALNFAVAYWDQLGWKDTFAKPAFTKRQWDYAHAGARRNVATPQVIINGRTAVVGNDLAQLKAAIRSSERGNQGPEISVRNGQVLIAAAAGAHPSLVWLVSYDPRVINVPIRAGENGGRTIPHRNIVRLLIKLGSWNGQAAAFPIPGSTPPILHNAVIVQRGLGGPIISARPI
ncbi:MAG: DUF1223 domain-containing protein [Sphingomicrobium sp.]